MKAPLIMHQGGHVHLEHMIARLDDIENELLSFRDIAPGYYNDEVDKALVAARENAVVARTNLKKKRLRIKARRA